MYTNLCNMVHEILFIIPHIVRVEACVSCSRDVIVWKQSEPAGETLREQVTVRQFARANNGLQAGDDSVLDASSTHNDMEMIREAEENKLLRMAKVHNNLEMWQGSQNLQATQKEYRAQKEQMTAAGYISDTEEIMKAT
jgi:hypothetical protein